MESSDNHYVLSTLARRIHMYIYDVQKRKCSNNYDRRSRKKNLGKSARPRALGIFCHQGAWPDSLLNYHLLSPIARVSLNRAARPGFSWPARAPLFGVANPVEICGVEEWSVAEGRSGAPRLSTAYNSPPRPRGLSENASPAQRGPRRERDARPI